MLAAITIAATVKVPDIAISHRFAIAFLLALLDGVAFHCEHGIASYHQCAATAVSTAAILEAVEVYVERTIVHAPPADPVLRLCR
jgi:hypothetical protein